MLVAQKLEQSISENSPLTLESHAKILCSDLDGYIGIAFKTKTDAHFSQRFARTYSDFLHIISCIPVNKCDIWVTHNAFYLPKRRTNCIRQLRALYVDIDCYKRNIAPDNAMYWLEKDYFRKIIPEPNIVIYSGQGLQLIWQIEIEGMYSASKWKSAEKLLASSLEPFGADQAATDIPRLLRLTGTINHKTGNTVVSYLRHTYIESLASVLNEYFGTETNVIPSPPSPVILKSPKRAMLPKPIFTKQNSPFFNLAWDRKEDLKKLIKLRAEFYPKEGTHNGLHGREVLLFLYRYFALSHDSGAQVLDDCLELNQMFKHPLSKEEVIAATSSAEVGYHNYVNYENNENKTAHSGYRYKTQTLVTMLEISDIEAKLLKTIITKNEKNRRRTLKRRAAGIKAATGKSDAEGIKSLKAKEPRITQAEIAKRLGVSQSQVSRTLSTVKQKHNKK